MQPYALVLVGSESVGKSSIANAIADRYALPVVDEFARQYLAGREQFCTAEDLLEIYMAQSRLQELALTRRDARLIVFDTDSNTTLAWARFLEKPLPSSTQPLRWASQATYLLLEEDLGWEADGARLYPNQRTALRHCIADVLNEANIPFTPVRGSWPRRFAVVCDFIERFRG